MDSFVDHAKNKPVDEKIRSKQAASPAKKNASKRNIYSLLHSSRQQNQSSKSATRTTEETESSENSNTPVVEDIVVQPPTPIQQRKQTLLLRDDVNVWSHMSSSSLITTDTSTSEFVVDFTEKRKSLAEIPHWSEDSASSFQLVREGPKKQSTADSCATIEIKPYLVGEQRRLEEQVCHQSKTLLKELQEQNKELLRQLEEHHKHEHLKNERLDSLQMQNDELQCQLEQQQEASRKRERKRALEHQRLVKSFQHQLDQERLARQRDGIIYKKIQSEWEVEQSQLQMEMLQQREKWEQERAQLQEELASSRTEVETLSLEVEQVNLQVQGLSFGDYCANNNLLEDREEEKQETVDDDDDDDREDPVDQQHVISEQAQVVSDQQKELQYHRDVSERAIRNRTSPKHRVRRLGRSKRMKRITDGDDIETHTLNLVEL